MQIRKFPYLTGNKFKPTPAQLKNMSFRFDR